MSRKSLQNDDERMSSVTFSLAQSQLQYIRKYGAGANMSEQLRNILEESKKFTGAIVRYNVEDIADGEFTPEFQAEGAVLVYYKSPDGYGFGDNLPFTPALPRFVSFQQMAEIVTKRGYTTQLVKFEDYDFKALWAMKAADRCMECKRKIKDAAIAGLSDILFSGIEI